jgi:hypothetical protein
MAWNLTPELAFARDIELPSRADSWTIIKRLIDPRLH